jgi:hypothetical protein
VFAATVMPAAVALADGDEGGADSGTEGGTDDGTGGTDGTAGTDDGTAGTEGVDDGVDDVGLADDEDPGLGAEPGVSADPGTGTGGASGPVGATPAGAVAPTQHEVTPPGPASIPTALPGPPNRVTMPGADMLPGLACCPTSGPGGNTKEHGQHESDE